ncbi:MAG: hypothetical protein GXY51_02600 [Bacteroidetes bacterium]|nr:hypothetical protein [Bacteroidota bacterium]
MIDTKYLKVIIKNCIKNEVYSLFHYRKIYKEYKWLLDEKKEKDLIEKEFPVIMAFLNAHNCKLIITKSKDKFGNYVELKSIYESYGNSLSASFYCDKDIPRLNRVVDAIRSLEKQRTCKK